MERDQPPTTAGVYPSDYFRRQDESADTLFYAQPRLLVHIDDYAIEAIRSYFSEALPADGVILDLLSSWRSHLPEEPPLRQVVGLGLNSVEMAENPQLDEHVVHDVNADSTLPFEDGSFDAAVLTVSVQYLTKPAEVFAEVNRAVRAGGSFHVVYSNRMFPTKAVWIWQSLDDTQRAELITSYFRHSGGWEEPRRLDISPKQEFYTDPVYVVSARKRA